MLLNFRGTVEDIAKEKSAYLSSNDIFKLSKLEREADSLEDAISEIKNIKDIRLKFKEGDFRSIKKRVRQT
ncbi:MAG TPA: hypothetical protein ENH35_03475 [Candidatus Moranbacteria bacterium]|nr:hypothetical protein [Candidatus Moranbacteria bacterium]